MRRTRAMRRNKKQRLAHRPAAACQKSGCGHFFEKEERRLRTAQIRLVAMLPDGGFARNFLAGGEKNPPRRQSRRIQ